MQKIIFLKKLLIIGIIISMFGTNILNSSIIISANIVYPKNIDKNFSGHILYTPEYSTKTYLINNKVEIVNIWTSNYLQGMATYLLENGEILRSDLPFTSPTFWGGGLTGCVEKFNWYNEREWEFIYSDNKHCLHHDIEPLPNGNILMIAWEYKSKEEAIAAGRNPVTLFFDYMWSEQIIEVKPTGPTSGEIVWEWNAWDHLIQDFDPSEANYGVVKNNPGLIDINFPHTFCAGDWLHINSIDYNEHFDQILLSSRANSEVWIINHNITTEEAVGRKGDLIYRWGNSQAYDIGTDEKQNFFDQHDARWIEPGYPGEGNILVFCNGKTRKDFKYSSVDEIVPPVDENGAYEYIENVGFGPNEITWSYTSDDFYVEFLSGAQRLYDGNTLICNGPDGYFFVVTPEKQIVWEYTNPYPSLPLNDVFTIHHYPTVDPSMGSNLDCEGSLNWIDVKTSETVYGSFNVQNIGDSGSFLNWEIQSFPSWGTWSFDPDFGEKLKPEDGKIIVNVSVVAPYKKNEEFIGSLRIQNIDNSTDFEIIPIYLKTLKNKAIITNFFFIWFLEQFPILQMLLQRLGLQ